MPGRRASPSGAPWAPPLPFHRSVSLAGSPCQAHPTFWPSPPSLYLPCPAYAPRSDLLLLPPAPAYSGTHRRSVLELGVGADAVCDHR